MRAVNKEAWDILLEDEKMALSLQLGMDKSSWESGEIMNKSHYKYLEIKYRAEKFLKMFTEYFELFDDLIPNYLKGDETVKAYFIQCIKHRAKPSEVISQLGVKKKDLNNKIIEQIKKWEVTNDAYGQSIRELILEFDRWNNFRILPKTIQEPSAFKRRIKNIYKKHLNTLTHIHPLGLDKLIRIYRTNRAPFAYLPVIVNKEPTIIKVKNTITAKRDLYELGFYLFDDIRVAQEYIDAVHAYQYKKGRVCRDGLEFWPLYRGTIKKALNYEQIQQITPSRKYLELAMQKIKYV